MTTIDGRGTRPSASLTRRRTTCRLALVTLVLLASGRSVALAQVTLSGGYGVIGAVPPDIASVTPSTVVDGVGGSAFLVMLGVAAQVTRKISAGLEIVIPQAFEFGSATARAGTTNGTFRDIVFSGLLKVRVATHLEAVGGVSIIKEDLVATSTAPSVGLNPGPPSPVPVQNDLGLSLGSVMGADVVAPVSPHVTIVPNIRLHLIHRGSFETSKIGLGTAEVQAGVAVRVAF